MFVVRFAERGGVCVASTSSRVSDARGAVPDPKGGVLREGAPRRRWLFGLVLVASMVLVAVASLVNVDDAVPGVQVDTSAAGDAGRDLDLDRSQEAAASRSSGSLYTARIEEATSTTVAPTTTTAAPTTTAVPTTTTARPTTTTARPTTTTARPTTTAVPPPTTTTAPPATTTTAPPNVQEGEASYYAAAAPDECAHRTLAFGTIVTVTNLANGKRTTCRVGDRGPFVEGRIIDLSEQTFAELAPLSEGVISVRINW